MAHQIVHLTAPIMFSFALSPSKVKVNTFWCRPIHHDTFEAITARNFHLVCSPLVAHILLAHIHISFSLSFCPHLAANQVVLCPANNFSAHSFVMAQSFTYKSLPTSGRKSSLSVHFLLPYLYTSFEPANPRLS